MLDRRQRLIRSAFSVVVFGALVAGAARGDDHHFPFGPMRMYSTTTKTTGSVTLVRFEATTASGKRLELRSKDFALRPAELLGQVPRIRDNPQVLRYVAQAYEGERLVHLRLYFLAYRLRDGVPAGYEVQEVAEWRA